MNSVQKELEVRIRDDKEVHRRKVENKFQQNNVRDMRSGMKITGFKQKEDQTDGS